MSVGVITSTTHESAAAAPAGLVKPPAHGCVSRLDTVYVAPIAPARSLSSTPKTAYARSRRASNVQDNGHATIALTALNGDVLHEIVSYLRGRDALHLSLTARRVHDFAVHRVASHLVCRSAADLRTIHEHILKGHPSRAVFLRSLSITASTFIDRPWQEDPNWAFPETTYEYSLAPLVGDILQAAQGLTHLQLEHFAPLVQHEPRVGSAIASMSRLDSLELRQTDPDSLDVFLGLRSRPHHLHVSTVKTTVPSEAKRVLDYVYDLLAAISHRKQLRVLDLDLSAISCRPFKVPTEPKPDPIPLPYVHHLSVHWFSQLVDVASLFPNLDVFEQHISSFHVEKSSSKALRRLSITELRAQSSTHQPVHMLHLRKYPRDLQSFLKTVREISPVGLSMHCFIDTPQWIKYWEELPQTAPRLKFMDVHCHTWERSPQAGWVTRFIDSLRGYSLVCLRIIAPQPPAPGSDNARWLEEDVQALAELPDRLLHVIPTLCYVAWAAKRGVSEYAWYEDEYDCACAEYKWYCAVDGDTGGRKLAAISAGDGERVRRFLLEADMEAIAGIDAHLSIGMDRDRSVLDY
ncbi:hypothetical protein C8Q76DRAFT_798660 [Earliella scabrosa]|nr:hypothetical protein C8Q76DRAFT_798660 [Earliella scabrosa]